MIGETNVASIRDAFPLHFAIADALLAQSGGAPAHCAFDAHQAVRVLFRSHRLQVEDAGGAGLAVIRDETTGRRSEPFDRRRPTEAAIAALAMFDI